MKPDYYSFIYNEIEKVLIDSPIKVKIIKTYRDGVITPDHRKEMNGDNQPSVVLTFSYEYIIDESINVFRTISDSNSVSLKEINIENEYPLDACTHVVITTNDIQQSKLLEDYIVAKFEEKREIKIPYPNDNNEQLLISLKLDKSKDIYRTKGDRLASGISLKCEWCVAFKEEYSPVEIAFDENIQYDALRMIVALYDLYYHFQKKCFQNDICGEEYKKYREKYYYFKKMADDLIESTGIFYHEYDDSYFAKEIYKLYIQNNKDLKSALEASKDLKKLMEFRRDKFYEDIYSMREKKTDFEKKREAKEKEKNEKHRIIEEIKRDLELKLTKIEDIRKLKQLSCGDTMANCYTDVVVSKIRDLFEGKIPIYGGSNYMTYFSDFENGTIRYPSICILPNDEFTTNYHFYLLTDQYGETKSRIIDLSSSIPYVYGVTFLVNYDKDTKDRALKIVDYLKRSYYNPVTFFANNPNEKETFLPITLNISKDENIFWKKLANNGNPVDCYEVTLDNNGKYCFVVNTVKYCSVYFINDYSKETIYGNPWRQIMLLKKALFFNSISYKISDLLQRELPNRYKDLIEGNDVSIKYKYDKPYLLLFDRYYGRQPVSRELFDNAMKSIVDYYPMLYDRFVKGWSYGEIEREIRSLENYYKNSFISICNELDIPHEFINDPLGCAMRNNLEAIINSMKNNNADITEAVYLQEREQLENQLRSLNSSSVFSEDMIQPEITTIDSYFKGIPDDYYDRPQYYEKILKTEIDNLEVNKIFAQYENQMPQVENQMTQTDNYIPQAEYYMPQYYEGFYDEQSYIEQDPSNGGNFARGVLATIAGNMITNHFEHKRHMAELEEARKREEERYVNDRVDREFRELRERNEENERKARETKEKMRKYNMEMEAYYNAQNVNRERQQKGLPPLPLPPHPTFPS